MNNPLAQRAQYYLNESSRLSEELNSEIEYSAVLEAVLEELVGTENFLKIMELYVPKPGVSATHKVVDGKRVERTDAEKERYGAHLGKIMDISDRATEGIRVARSWRETPEGDAGAIDKQKSIQSRAHGALTLQGGNTGNGQEDHPKLMNFASGGATPEARASIGISTPANAFEVGVAAKKNDVTGAIEAKKGINAAKNVQTGSAGRAMAFNAARRGEGISVGSRGKGGTPRTVETGTRKNRQGLLFPVNASYDPNLVQDIMNLLTSNRNENVMDEGIIGTAVKKTGNVIKRAANTTGSILNSLDKDDGKNINYLGKDGKPIPKTEFNKQFQKKPINSSYEPDLVQGISDLLTSNEKKNNIAVNELSDATHTSYREKGTKSLAQRGYAAQIIGMHLGNATARAPSGPHGEPHVVVQALATDGEENARIIRNRRAGLLRSGRLKPLGGQPLDMSKPKVEPQLVDMSKPKEQGPIGKIRGAAEAQRKLLGNIKPINSSYEPDLVQGIMNLLANSRNENDLSEGQAKMLRMQDSAKRQQLRTGTVNPGLASDLNRAKTQNIIKALGTTQLPGAMVSGKDMGYIDTPQLQRLRVGERLTGMRAAGEDRSGLSHSLVSASRDTGNFHPDTDGAGGDVGHVEKVNRYGKVKAELGQSISQAHGEANAMEAAKRQARGAFETSRTRTPEEIKQLKIGHSRKIT